MIKIISSAEAEKTGIRGMSSDIDYAPYEKAVSEILNTVKEKGDRAVLEYTAKFDGAVLSSVELGKEEWDKAVSEVSSDYAEMLQRAADNISAFHSEQVLAPFEIKKENGIRLGQRVTPLKRVGIYVPGGTASYPSTVLMNAIPAKIAGVDEIFMATPPSKDGTVRKEVLAAAKIAGVTRIFKMGGAQAIAALAYGTESVPAVDKITGPGNIFVATAKRMVFGKVDIDMVAGPSEILIVADSSARADFIAADLLSQAEHDKLAGVALLTPNKDFAVAVQKEVEKQLEKAPRKEIASAAVENNGKIILVDDVDEAFDIANELAPEHLELAVEEPFKALEKIRNAGSVFLGNYSPEPLGDYFAGPNHTLPTSGTARFSSPLSVYDFVKRSSYIYYTEEALSKVSGDIESFAKSEGLYAHANSISIRK